MGHTEHQVGVPNNYLLEEKHLVFHLTLKDYYAIAIGAPTAYCCDIAYLIGLARPSVPQCPSV